MAVIGYFMNYCVTNKLTELLVSFEFADCLQVLLVTEHLFADSDSWLLC